MDINTLKEIIVEQNSARKHLPTGTKRQLLKKIENYYHTPHVVILAGMRRTGKSTLQRQIQQSHYPESTYFFNFEDERLLNFKVADLNKLFEAFVELYGEQKVFFLDEIQNIPGWETFVRRMQDSQFKFFITGSNASLLSRELGTKLTGRHVNLNVFPFSFHEYLKFNQFVFTQDMLLQTQSRGVIKNYFQQYLQFGGLPEFLQYKDLDLIKRTYDDILYRDIITRYDIKAVKSFRELSLYLLSNINTLLSYRKLTTMLELGSVTTVKNFIDYLENSYLFFTLKKYSPSIKTQTVANKKIYCIDNGLIEAVAFQFSNNHGRYLENLVFIELMRRGKEIYYYHTQGNLEVDFVIREGKEITQMIQVCHGFNSEKTTNREINSLLAALEEVGLKEGMILTQDHSEKLIIKDKNITILPVYQWLLEASQ